MKSIQVANTQVESISEEDIKSILNDFSDNVYLKQNLILFICDKNDIESYKKEVIKRFISRMKRDCMMVYILIILTSIIVLMLLSLFNEEEASCIFTVRIFSLLVTICLIYLSYFLWNNTFTSNIRQWWSAFFLVNYIALYIIMFLFLGALFLANLPGLIPDDSHEDILKFFLFYCCNILIILCLGLLIVFLYFIPNNCEHKDSDLQKVLSKLEEIEKRKRLEKEEEKKKK